MSFRQQLQLDIGLQFGRYCSADLDDAAREKLGMAIDQAVYQEHEKGAIPWDPETRKFVLARVAEAAHKCEQKAKDGRVTVAIMKGVVEQLVPKWKKECIIPDPPAHPKKLKLKGMGEPCDAVPKVFQPQQA